MNILTYLLTLYCVSYLQRTFALNSNVLPNGKVNKIRLFEKYLFDNEVEKSSCSKLKKCSNGKDIDKEITTDRYSNDRNKRLPKNDESDVIENTNLPHNADFNSHKSDSINKKNNTSIPNINLKTKNASNIAETQNSDDLDEAIVEINEHQEEEDKETDIQNGIGNEDTTTINTRYKRIRLPTFEDIKLNKAITVELPGEIEAKMKVLNTDPLIFEIDNFIDEEESELLIDIARTKTFKTVPNRIPNMEFKTPEQTFQEWDYNQDGVISTDEVIILPGLANIKFTEQDADDMFFMLKMDKNKDGVIELNEMKETDFTRARNYFNTLKSDVARQRNITSRTTWLWHDNDGLLKYNRDGYFEEFHERISSVTGIPVAIIEESEPLQLKHFTERQFQVVRQDSEPYNRDAPCCLYGDANKVCRLCRYISYTIFLNDVEEGGELVFPLANHTYQDVMKNSGEWRGYYIYAKTTGNRFYFKVDLSFQKDGANNVMKGDGKDESGGFIFQNSIIIGETIQFEKRYKDESNGDVIIKSSGKIIEGTKISGVWWIPNRPRMRGTFFMWNREYEIFSARAIDQSNQQEGCSSSNSLKIKPKKGKAIFWYNHHFNPRDGMVGDINQESMSAHCEVGKGEKWIASSWLNVIGDGDLEIRAWRRGDNWFAFKNQHTQNIYEMLGTNEPKLPNELYENEYIAEQLGTNRTLTDDTVNHGYHHYKPASNALQALNLLLNDLDSDQLRLVAQSVHKKLNMQCIPLTVEHEGKISFVDGSAA